MRTCSQKKRVIWYCAKNKDKGALKKYLERLDDLGPFSFAGMAEWLKASALKAEGLCKDGKIHAVIGLPEKLFLSTRIPTVIAVLSHQKEDGIFSLTLPKILKRENGKTFFALTISIGFGTRSMQDAKNQNFRDISIRQKSRKTTTT